MKIEKNIAFRISDEGKSPSSLSRLKTGGNVHAKILERLNEREAIIDLAGKRARVEFLKGVPKSNRFILTVEGRDNNTYYFKILERINKSELIKSMADFSIFDFSEMKKVNAGLMNKLFKNGLPGIYAFNLILIRELKKDSGDNTGGLSNIIRILLGKGLKPENALFLSMLFFTGKGLNSEQLISLIMILSFAERYNNKDRGNINFKENIYEKIDDIIKIINDIKESGDKDEIIRDLIENFISTANSAKNGFSCGEILYFDDNDSKELRYILNNNSILISLTLTYIGNLEILIKTDNTHCNIIFFCENDKSAEALKSGSDVLFSTLKDVSGKNFNIFFNNRKEAAEKIIEISSFLSQSIDVRV
ncbi:MAG: hypothetical protein MUC95_09630 [Spirochaetes bacterium]|nr:hypothetical protein [Spirochaetota bacterium]